MEAQDAAAVPSVSEGERLRSFLSKIGGVGGESGSQPLHDSADDFARQLQQTRDLLKEQASIDRSKLTKDESIDLRYAESVLVGRELAQAEMQRWKKDPRIYLQFRAISMLIAMPDPDQARGERVVAELSLIPERLNNGVSNLEVCIPRFRDLSLFMVENALSIFQQDVPRFADQLPTSRSSILAANAAALKALLAYQAFLKDALPKLPVADFAIGRKSYDAMLLRQYMLDYDAESLYKFAWDQFRQLVQEAESVARRIDPSAPWLKVAESIKQQGPAPTDILEVHQEWVNKARAHVVAHDLVPIPWKERVDVVPRAEYLRKTSYYGNFSMARRPDKDGVFVGQWQINTFLPSWSDEEKHQYMVEHDWGVIIDTAPHETYCGHHIQGLYQLHNPSLFRRTSSISIFSEGWGLYVERLMQETGFFPNEKIHLRNLQLRLWRIARVIWDVGMNTGQMSYDQAVTLLVEQVGFQRWAAELEVDYAAEHPGYQLGYFMGYFGIVQLREEFRALRGGQFSYSDFHERLLKVGCMPIKLMREGLMNSLT